ncbi:hypothetical protein [Ottowia testudinis]|uniref:SMI1/KNR4 family protein n=1 Tax=Ottowia testudinis TaxID=2816950 RepID=A0A975H1W5_9BURK|nr:hypothetical protein [Ottowia testudinis]QTD44179.1 hypothetical protein J1M35_13715 [Ottowia testudinis]
MNAAMPAAYLDFMAVKGAYEGAVRGEPGYVAMWAADECEALHVEFEVSQWLPGLRAFGGDGGGELLLFDAAGAVWRVPMADLRTASLRRVADSFSELAARFVG